MWCRSQRSLARFLLDEDPVRALAFLHESLELAREYADRNAIVELLETASAVAVRRGDATTGALLWGAAGALRAESGAIRQPDEEAWASGAEAALRKALGPDEFESGVVEGAALPSTRRSIAPGRSAVTRS